VGRVTPNFGELLVEPSTCWSKVRKTLCSDSRLANRENVKDEMYTCRPFGPRRRGSAGMTLTDVSGRFRSAFQTGRRHREHIRKVAPFERAFVNWLQIS